MIARACRQLLALLALALVPATVSGVLQLRSITPEPQIDAATVRTWGERVLWVDARPRRDYDQGHLEGAVLLNEDEWNNLIPEFLNAWDPDVPIVVYCGGGGCGASKAIAARLRTELQMENVHVLKGGLRSWRSE